MPRSSNQAVYGLDAAPREFIHLLKNATKGVPPGESQVWMDRLVCHRCGATMRLGSERTGELYWRCSMHRTGRTNCEVKYDAAVRTVTLITNAENAVAS